MITFGSDLKAPADMIEAHGADSAFWNVNLLSGGAVSAPEGGQVTVVRIKGTVVPDPTGRRKPTPMIHFQTLHPMGDGSFRVDLSSAAFYTPIGGDPNTISSYRPVNMCLRKGDILDFNDIGGNEWYWGPYDGMPFQTFSRVPGSSVNFYTKNNGTNIGSQWSPMQTKPAEELLMQMKFATGPDATDVCPGGYSQHVFRGTDLRNGQLDTLRTSTNEAKVRITCPGLSYGGCAGIVQAEAVLNGQKVLLGQGPFDTPYSYSDSVMIPISNANVRAIQRLGSVKVRLTATSHDDPRHDKRVKQWRSLSNGGDTVPVQSKTTTATVTFTADRPLDRKTSHHKKKKHKKHRRAAIRR